MQVSFWCYWSGGGKKRNSILLHNFYDCSRLSQSFIFWKPTFYTVYETNPKQWTGSVVLGKKEKKIFSPSSPTCFPAPWPMSLSLFLSLSTYLTVFLFTVCFHSVVVSFLCDNYSCFIRGLQLFLCVSLSVCMSFLIGGPLESAASHHMFTRQRKRKETADSCFYSNRPRSLTHSCCLCFLTHWAVFPQTVALSSVCVWVQSEWEMLILYFITGSMMHGVFTKSSFDSVLMTLLYV